MLNIKIVYNDSCKEVIPGGYENLPAVNPMFEFYNESDPKVTKTAWKFKGEAGAKQVPFFAVYDNGILIKAFYNEDSSSNWENLMKWLNDYISTHARYGNIKVTKIEGNENTYPLGYTESGFTSGLMEGIACAMADGDHYFHTSIVTSINWEDKTFKTLNSTYKFEFL